MLNVENLDVKLENKSLMFYNIKDGNIKYRMLQPYIKYKNQIDSTVSQYKVEKIDKDELEYLLTIEIDLSKYDLIEKNNDLTRLLPNGPELVIIGTLDGGSGGGSSTPIVYDTYVSSTNTTTNYGSSSEVKISSGNTQIGYFKINEPAIPDGSTITDAFFRIPYYFTTSSSNYVNIGAYQILSDWSETSVTWSSNTNISSTRLSSAYTYTYASATENNPEYVTLGIVEAAKSWYSRSSNNYGIAVKFENGNESTVFMKSWESHTESSTMTIDYNMDALIVNEGTYFIKNEHLDKYLQIDDDDFDNSYNTENAILEVFTGTCESFQKWDFEYLHNGYYKIKSYRSSKVISVENGNENSINDALVQQTYNGSDRQQWKITSTSSGKLKIKAKSSEEYSTDLVMCIGEGIGENGRNVEQREYSNNDIYKDEWILEILSNKIISFCGINNSGHEHSFCLETSKENLFNEKFNNSSVYTGSIPVATCLYYLKNSTIFTSRSHGKSFETDGTVTTTGIILNDLYGSEEIGLYSHYDSRLTSGSSNVAVTDNFSGLELALFIGCQTGRGGVGGNNLPSIVVAQGAEVAVGFTEDIDCVSANQWTIMFYNYLLAGETVQNAVISASNKFTSNSGLRSAIVCGNGNYTIK